MDLVKAHGGIGEYRTTPEEASRIRALFDEFEANVDVRKEGDWERLKGRVKLFYAHFPVLFPNHELFANSMGTPIVHYRGSAPYSVAVGARQLIVRVNDSFNGTFQSAQLRVISPPESDNIFLTFALNQHYVQSCIDDVAEGILKKETGGKVPGVRELPRKEGRREYGLACVNDIASAKKAYDAARKLVKTEGMKEELLNGLRAESVRSDDHGNSCKELYAEKVGKLLARYSG